MGAEFDTCDVGGAYFHGTPTPPEEGGRAVFAEVPKYLHKFGAYQTHNEQGHKNYLRILGNMPGRKDAGAIWARRYDSFLLGIGMRQSVVDRRLFIIATDEGTLMAHIHVDDTRLTFTNRRMRAWFMEKWSAEFDEKPMKSELDEDFVGVTRSVPRSGTIEYTCGGVIKSMHELIKPHPLGQGVTDAYPMSATAPREIATDSTGAQELVMATTCYKYVAALRMLLLDMRVGAEQMDPTPMYTDSQILLDGTDCERLVKSSRWLASRYAMIRYGKACGVINPIKVPGEDNVADIVTKALTGQVFRKHRATLLGHAWWRQGAAATAQTEAESAQTE